MVNRDDIVAVLRHWFPNVSEDVVDGAAGEIADLPDEWEEVTSKEEELGYHYSAKCVEICYLADQVDRGAEFRLFRKRRAKTWQ
jgi:hypothetical protein